MKELDVVLERYVSSRLRQACPAERRLLARLLEWPDPVLAEYLLEEATPVEPDMARLIGLIRGV